jgi:hypothetical protein
MNEIMINKKEYKEASSEIYSNYDHVLNLQVVEEIIQKKLYAFHTAWNFCGTIYFDKINKEFIEEIKIYGSLDNIIKHKDIKVLIENVNSIYGAD